MERLGGSTDAVISGPLFKLSERLEHIQRKSYANEKRSIQPKIRLVEHDDTTGRYLLDEVAHGILHYADVTLCQSEVAKGSASSLGQSTCYRPVDGLHGKTDQVYMFNRCPQIAFDDLYITELYRKKPVMLRFDIYRMTKSTKETPIHVQTLFSNEFLVTSKRQTSLEPNNNNKSQESSSSEPPSSSSPEQQLQVVLPELTCSEHSICDNHHWLQTIEVSPSIATCCASGRDHMLPIRVTGIPATFSIIGVKMGDELMKVVSINHGTTTQNNQQQQHYWSMTCKPRRQRCNRILSKHPLSPSWTETLALVYVDHSSGVDSTVPLICTQPIGTFTWLNNSELHAMVANVIIQQQQPSRLPNIVV
jgi:hypothetical protein